jgi:hypothetical protein
VLLVAVARSSRLRWAATLTCAFYMLIACAMVWILPLFPAQPMLGPINNPVDHMVPPLFPLLLIVPAVAVDWLLQRRPEKRSRFIDPLLIGAAFLALLFAVHWYFSEFQLSPASRNWFFAGDQQWDYSSNAGELRYQFWNLDDDPVTPQRLAGALALAVGSSAVGLWWGRWMAKVRR